MRIAITGKMCSGKTHVAKDTSGIEGRGILHVLLASPIKKICEEILNLENGLILAYEYLNYLGVGDYLNTIHGAEKGWNNSLLDNQGYLNKLTEIRILLKETQDLPFTPPKSRLRLQHLGTDFRTRIYDRVWIDILLNSLEDDKSYVCDDCRFMNEYEALKDKGFTIIKLTVSPEIQKKRLENLYGEFDPKILMHASELDFDKMEASPGMEIDADQPLEEMLTEIREKLGV